MDQNKIAHREDNLSHTMAPIGDPINLYATLLRRGVLFALFWWVLNIGDNGSWLIGVPCIVAAIALSVKLAAPRPLRWRPLQVIRFIPIFLWGSLKGGIDVTQRVIRPKMPLHPIIFNYKVTLPSGLPRLLMLNTVSLLPGTLSADLHEDQLTLHVLDQNTPFESELQRIENLIAGMITAVPEADTP